MKCAGCGEELQTKDPNKVGYTPVIKEDKETLLCQRCFRLKHYGEFSKIKIQDETFNNVFKEISKKKCDILYVIDIFNIYGSIIEDINSLVGNNSVHIVLNKIDLLPELNNKRILNYVVNVLNNYHIQYEDIYLCSSLKKYYIDEIIEEIKEYKKDIYVIGRSNAGKSSFINALNNAILKESNVTESYFAGTTLKTIKIPFNKHFIYDTPGMDNSSSIYDYLNLKNLRKVLIQEEIKPISMSIHPNEVLMIGGVGYVEFDIKDKINIIMYGSRYIKYQKTNNKDISNKFDKFSMDNLTFPKLNRENLDKDLSINTYNINKDRASLIINGITWIDMIKIDGNIKTHLPSYLGVRVDKSLFGGK